MGRGRRALYHLWGEGLFGYLLYRYRPARLDRPESGTIAKVLVRSLHCCGSGMFIPDPGSKNSNNREGWKKIHKIEYYFIFEMPKKKNLGKFSKNYLSFYQKSVHYALKYMGLGSGIRIRDPRSGTRKKPIPDPGVRGQKGTGSRIPDPESGSATLVINRHML
jgi:hypothetical protein